MSVLGQPSVLYLRLSQPSSRYQPSRPCSAIFASTSSSVYVLGFSSVATGNRLLTRALHHNATVDVYRLPGDERRLGGSQIQRRCGDVRRSSPAAQRSRLRHRAPELVVRLLRERGLDPARAEDVDAHLRAEGTGQALAVGEHAALDRAEQLGIVAGHAGRDVVPAHVHDRAPGLLTHHGAGRVRACDGALEVDGQEEIQLALPIPAGGVPGEHVGAGVVDPHVEAAEALPRLRDERLAARARTQVGARDKRAVAPCRDAVDDRVRRRLAAAVRHEHGRTGAGERLGDRGADAAARARDDGAYAVEPVLGPLWGAVLRLGYASAPAANGCRAASDESRICCMLGSPLRARAIDSFAAW